MTETQIHLTSNRPNRGKFPVSLMRGDEVLVTGQVNPHKAKDVDGFINSACEKLPGIKDRAEDLRRELLQLAAPKLSSNRFSVPISEQNHPYAEMLGGIVWKRPGIDGESTIPLTNFTARIVGNVVRDDGAEQERAFEIEATLGGRRRIFTIPASRFAVMNWPIDCLGAEAIVYPSPAVKDHARVAIQLLSPKPIPMRTIFTHTGWRKLDGGNGGNGGWVEWHFHKAQPMTLQRLSFVFPTRKSREPAARIWRALRIPQETLGFAYSPPPDERRRE